MVSPGLSNVRVIAAGSFHSHAKTHASTSMQTIYGYDKLSRLTSVNAPGTAEDTTYLYDPVGAYIAPLPDNTAGIVRNRIARSFKIE